MGKPHIKLYVDTISPFAYMGYWILRNSPTFKSCDIEYVPILLGGLFKSCGNTAPLNIKNKDAWINRERLAWANLFNIPMRKKTPPGFPIPTVNTQRALVALSQKSPEHIPAALDLIYAAIWCPETLPSSTNKPPSGGAEYNINKAEDLMALLSSESSLGKDLAKQIVEATSSPDVKAQLVKNTEEAFKEGAFGLPWFQCRNEKGEEMGFWGFDHLGQVCRFLGVELEGAKDGVKAML